MSLACRVLCSLTRRRTHSVNLVGISHTLCKPATSISPSSRYFATFFNMDESTPAAAVPAVAEIQTPVTDFDCEDLAKQVDELNISNERDVGDTVSIGDSRAESEQNEKSSHTVVPADTTSASLAKTAVYFHPTCSLHRIPDHPEQHMRVDQILSILKRTWPHELKFRESKPVTKDQILLFHTPPLLARFQKLAENALLTYQKKKTVVYLPIDQDTTVMWQTRAAAFHAAGAVICALDHMYAPDNDDSKIDTAFCCVRPPGHHAERDKAGGFCFFNNVAIGARYAQLTHKVGKVAILDPDVHHGNGTEEGFTDDPSVFYGSTHGRDHYPGTGRDPSPHVGERAKREVDRRIVNRLLTPGPESRAEFRVKWREILDEMERFQPELVMMSMGFDAHDDDPLASCELQDEDFHWFTSEVVASCARITAARSSNTSTASADGNTNTDASPDGKADGTTCKTVRYMSVLEGGYDLPAIQRSAVCHVRALLEGYPKITADGVVGTKAGAEQVPAGILGEGEEDTQQGTQRAPVDGEIAALREYLEAFGVKDL